MRASSPRHAGAPAQHVEVGASLRQPGGGSRAVVVLGHLEAIRRPVGRHRGRHHLGRPALPQLGMGGELQPFGRPVLAVRSGPAGQAVRRLRNVQEHVPGATRPPSAASTAPAPRCRDGRGVGGREVPDLHRAALRPGRSVASRLAGGGQRRQPGLAQGRLRRRIDHDQAGLGGSAVRTRCPGGAVGTGTHDRQRTGDRTGGDADGPAARRQVGERSGTDEQLVGGDVHAAVGDRLDREVTGVQAHRAARGPEVDERPRLAARQAEAGGLQRDGVEVVDGHGGSSEGTGSHPWRSAGTLLASVVGHVCEGLEKYRRRSGDVRRPPARAAGAHRVGGQDVAGPLAVPRSNGRPAMAMPYLPRGPSIDSTSVRATLWTGPVPPQPTTL